ncbi:uncharacterized protein BKA78DRAFT_181909 [Phyllosticta capitalensis]|uniref:uncharacterized protein n=1 Tax=Phyllosticta capitalensis TaxID=121624 RepID=UPI00312F218A
METAGEATLSRELSSNPSRCRRASCCGELHVDAQVATQLPQQSTDRNDRPIARQPFATPQDHEMQKALARANNEDTHGTERNGSRSGHHPLRCGDSSPPARTHLIHLISSKHQENTSVICLLTGSIAKETSTRPPQNPLSCIARLEMPFVSGTADGCFVCSSTLHAELSGLCSEESSISPSITGLTRDENSPGSKTSELHVLTLDQPLGCRSRRAKSQGQGLSQLRCLQSLLPSFPGALVDVDGI